MHPERNGEWLPGFSQDYFDSSGGWWNKLAEVFGTPDSTYFDMSNKQNATSNSYNKFWSRQRENPFDWDSLCVKHSPNFFVQHFRIYILTHTPDGNGAKLECQRVSRIEFDERQSLFRFFDDGDEYFPKDFSGIEIDATGFPSYF